MDVVALVDNAIPHHSHFSIQPHTWQICCLPSLVTSADQLSSQAHFATTQRREANYRINCLQLTTARDNLSARSASLCMIMSTSCQHAGRYSSFQRACSVQEQGRHDQADCGNHLDEHMQAGPGRVLEGVSDGVPCHRCFVRFATLAYTTWLYLKFSSVPRITCHKSMYLLLHQDTWKMLTSHHRSPMQSSLISRSCSPPCAPDSMYFFALSHAPPAVFRNSAISMPAQHAVPYSRSEIIWVECKGI